MPGEVELLLDRRGEAMAVRVVQVHAEGVHAFSREGAVTRSVPRPGFARITREEESGNSRRNTASPMRPAAMVPTCMPSTS